jgi:hypothetical protein
MIPHSTSAPKGALLASFCMGLGVLSFIPQPALAASSPVAFVYLSHAKSNSRQEIVAYSASADGKLTQVANGAIAANVSSMAVNGKYLFGSNVNGIYIAAFAIQPNGSLKWVTSTDVVHGCNTGPGAGSLVLDHTGADLYDIFGTGGDCEDEVYQSLRVDKATGKLDYLGAQNGAVLAGRLSFIGNNRFAYGAFCDPFTSSPGAVVNIDAIERTSSGALNHLMTDTVLPENLDGDRFCPEIAAADPANHVAFVGAFYQNETLLSPPRIAVFTADSQGKLTATADAAHMPPTAVTDDPASVYDLKMSPSGKLLAVSGPNGLQIFHFNEADPVTAFTGLLLSGTDIEQIFWDNANHLYAISHSSNKLYVFTATPTGVRQAAQSPYNITAPKSLIVQPK